MCQLFTTFFPKEYGGDVLSEITCEPYHTCNRDQIIYKGLITNWLSLVSQLAPYTLPEIAPKLKQSAEAAGTQCSGPDNACGIAWHNATWDGITGIEQEMAALSAFANTLVLFQSAPAGGYTPPKKPAPVTADTGGNSTSDPTGGQSGGGEQRPPSPKKVTNGDRAGAAILTVVFTTAWIGMMVWVAYGEFRF